ncbi:MAG TPA: hypothetical protein VEV87_08990 [Chitinophagaceae bacterium]|nr:hypothetical protein [Chitinophagaceae bacterium]
MKTLYLGPKVSMSLPFVLSYLKKLATILIATLFSLSVFPQELVFRNPVLVTGTRFLGPQQNFEEIDTAATRVMTTINYESANKFYFRTGGMRTGSGNSNAGDRMNSIWFKSFNYAVPLVKLPVKLANFNAVLQNKQVMLNWATTEEKNLSHFVIEKSIDSVEFKEAAIIFTDGNSEILKSYAYRDPLAADARVIYYRLRMVDLDKKEAFSSVRMIRASSAIKNQLELLTFPNPVVNKLRITIPESWQNRQVTYEMFDGAGRLVKTSGE